MNRTLSYYRKRIRGLARRARELAQGSAALAESERKYRAIFENTGTISIIFNEETTITMVNSDFAQRLGYAKEEVEGKRSWTEFVSPGDLERLLKWHRLRSKDPTAAPHTHEFKVVNRQGDELNIFMTIESIPGTTLRVASLMDVTDRVRAEEELIKISGRERQAIGQDLHDDLLPHLMGIEFLAKILANRIEKKSRAEAPQVQKIRSLIQDAIAKTRGFAHGLCPVFLVEHGLEFSLDHLAKTASAIYGIPCSFTGDNDIPQNGIETSTHLFYIAQEAVHNAIKHGKAANVSIVLARDGAGTILSVTDDGSGFDPASVSGGMGLRIMNHRARIIGAALAVRSEPGRGTTITASLRDAGCVAP